MDNPYLVLRAENLLRSPVRPSFGREWTHWHRCHWCGSPFCCTLDHSGGRRRREQCPPCQQLTFAEKCLMYEVDKLGYPWEPE